MWKLGTAAQSAHRLIGSSGARSHTVSTTRWGPDCAILCQIVPSLLLCRALLTVVLTAQRERESRRVRLRIAPAVPLLWWPRHCLCSCVLHVTAPLMWPSSASSVQGIYDLLNEQLLSCAPDCQYPHINVSTGFCSCRGPCTAVSRSPHNSARRLLHLDPSLLRPPPPSPLPPPSPPLLHVRSCPGSLHLRPRPTS